MAYKLGRYAGIPYRKSDNGEAYRLAHSIGFYKSINRVRARAYEYVSRDYTDTRFVEIWENNGQESDSDIKGGKKRGTVAIEGDSIVWIPHYRKGRVREVKPDGHLRLFRFHTR